MPLTPLEIEKVTFPKGFRGYVCDAVDEFVELVSKEFQRLYDEKADALKQVEALKLDLANLREREDLVKSSVILAQKAAEEAVIAAKREADVIVREAKLREAELRDALAHLEATKENFEFEFHGLLTGFLERLEAGSARLKAEMQGARSRAAKAAAGKSDGQGAPETEPKAAAPARGGAADAPKGA
jgi:cell division initiation protein